MKKRLLMLGIALTLTMSSCGNDFIEEEAKLQVEIDEAKANEALEKEIETENEVAKESNHEELLEESTISTGKPVTGLVTISRDEEKMISFMLPEDYVFYGAAYNYQVEDLVYVNDEITDINNLVYSELDVTPDENITPCQRFEYKIPGSDRYINVHIIYEDYYVYNSAKEQIDFFEAVNSSDFEYYGVVNGVYSNWLVYAMGMPNNTFYVAINEERPYVNVIFNNFSRYNFLLPEEENLPCMELNSFSSDEVISILEKYF